nr:MAG TPA: hypothetical protein [Caudoviricetes sp.]
MSSPFYNFFKKTLNLLQLHPTTLAIKPIINILSYKRFKIPSYTFICLISI